MLSCKTNLRAFILIMAFCCIGLLIDPLSAVTVNQQVRDVRVADAYGNQSGIPYLGNKVIAIIYADPDKKDMNDPLSNAMTDKKWPKEKVVMIGLVNMKDSWIADFALNIAIKSKQKQFSDAVIMKDQNSALRNAWNLGDCNDTSVVIIVGKDQTVKYVNKGPVRGSEINRVLQIIDASVAAK